MKNYTVDYFIDKFSKIPKNKWFSGRYQNPCNELQKCALGHCGITDDNLETDEANNLARVLNCGNISSINDGSAYYAYLGKHPKTRIINALKRIKRGLNL